MVPLLALFDGTGDPGRTTSLPRARSKHGWGSFHFRRRRGPAPPSRRGTPPGAAARISSGCEPAPETSSVVAMGTTRSCGRRGICRLAGRLGIRTTSAAGWWAAHGGQIPTAQPAWSRFWRLENQAQASCQLARLRWSRLPTRRFERRGSATYRAHAGRMASACWRGNDSCARAPSQRRASQVAADDWPWRPATPGPPPMPAGPGSALNSMRGLADDGPAGRYWSGRWKPRPAALAGHLDACFGTVSW